MSASEPPRAPHVEGGDRPATLPTRRQVLVGLAASGLGAGVLGSLVTACSDASEPEGSGSAPESTAVSRPSSTEAEDAIVRIGTRYRAERPEEDDLVLLLELLGLDLGDRPPSPADLAALGQQVTDDHASDRTVRLDGWVLSVTECRTAAVVSLS